MVIENVQWNFIRNIMAFSALKNQLHHHEHQNISGMSPKIKTITESQAKCVFRLNATTFYETALEQHTESQAKCVFRLNATTFYETALEQHKIKQVLDADGHVHQRISSHNTKWSLITPPRISSCSNINRSKCHASFLSSQQTLLVDQSLLNMHW